MYNNNNEYKSEVNQVRLFCDHGGLALSKTESCMGQVVDLAMLKLYLGWIDLA